MAYWITKFGSTSLPMINPVQDIGPGAVSLGLVTLPGGAVYDPHGIDKAPVQLPYPIQIEANVVGEDMREMQARLYELRALQGIRAQLFRTPDDAAPDSEWCWARLESVEMRREIGTMHGQPVTLGFAVLSHPWNGADRTINTLLDVTPKSITCGNAGNAQVTDVVVRVTAYGDAITALTVGIAGVAALEWTGTLGIGETLVIDCGARRVLCAGADAYGGFALGAGHAVTDWLQFDPGDTDVVVTRAGGGAATEIEIAYYDGWI